MTKTGDTHDAEDEAEDEAEQQTKQTRLSDVEPRDMRAQTDVGEIKKCSDGSYNVISRSSGNVYNVTLDPDTCECPDYEYRDTRCKHIRAVDREFGDDEVTREKVKQTAEEVIVDYGQDDVVGEEEVVERVESRLGVELDTVDVRVRQNMTDSGEVIDYEEHKALAVDFDEPLVILDYMVDVANWKDWELVWVDN